MMELNERAYVATIDSGVIYEYRGGNTFMNVKTGVTGEVPDDVAQANFYIPLRLNAVLMDRPELLPLVKELGLSVVKESGEGLGHE